MKHRGLTFTRLSLLAASASGLGGCVPISVEAYSRGHALDASLDASLTSDSPQGQQGQQGDASDAADAQTSSDGSICHAGKPSEPARSLDATAVDASSIDASLPGTTPADAGMTDAGQSNWRAPCAESGVFCDDFDGQTVACPTFRGLWSYCEMLGLTPEAKLLAQAAPHDLVLYSSTGQGLAASGPERSGRLAYDLPANLTNFHSAFDFFPQPGRDTFYTLWKLEQEVRRDENGEAQYYVGVSLVASENNLLLVVQTVHDAATQENEVAVQVRALPQTWTRVRIDIVIATQLEVTLAFDDEPSQAYPPFTRGTAQIDHVAVLLGVYSENPGGAAALYDNVVISARAP